MYSTSLRGMGFEVVYDVGSLLGTALYMYVYAYVYVDYVCNARVWGQLYKVHVRTTNNAS